MHPQWTEDDKLLFIADWSGFWNLYACDDVTDSNVQPRQLTHMTETDLSSPAWVFGCRTYSVLNSNQVLVALPGEDGARLVTVDISSGSMAKERLDSGCTTHMRLRTSSSGFVYVIAGSPTKVQRLVRIAPNGKADILRLSNNTSLDEGYISVPRHIKYPTEGGAVSHAYFYAPANKDFKAPEVNRNKSAYIISLCVSSTILDYLICL